MQPTCSRRWVPIKYLKVPSSLPIAFRGIHACTVRIPGVNQEWIQDRLAWFVLADFLAFPSSSCPICALTTLGCLGTCHIGHLLCQQLVEQIETRKGSSSSSMQCWNANCFIITMPMCLRISRILPDSLVIAAIVVWCSRGIVVPCRPISGGKLLLWRKFNLTKSETTNKLGSDVVVNQFPTKLCNTSRAWWSPLAAFGFIVDQSLAKPRSIRTQSSSVPAKRAAWCSGCPLDRNPTYVTQCQCAFTCIVSFMYSCYFSFCPFFCWHSMSYWCTISFAVSPSLSSFLIFSSWCPFKSHTKHLEVQCHHLQGLCTFATSAPPATGNHSACWRSQLPYLTGVGCQRVDRCLVTAKVRSSSCTAKVNRTSWHGRWSLEVGKYRILQLHSFLIFLTVGRTRKTDLFSKVHRQKPSVSLQGLWLCKHNCCSPAEQRAIPFLHLGFQCCLLNFFTSLNFLVEIFCSSYTSIESLARGFGFWCPVSKVHLLSFSDQLHEPCCSGRGSIARSLREVFSLASQFLPTNSVILNIDMYNDIYNMYIYIYKLYMIT